MLRDGRWQELPRRELVPGDVIRLTAGDLIPADARVLHAVDLHVQQAALTGESLPVAKVAQAPVQAGETLAERQNGVFLGTSVVSGTATAVITATGRATTFSDIVERLQHRPPETEFERGIRHFALFITQTVFFLILFVFLIGVLFQHNLFESVLFALALAVGLTPEFLPMITTVTLGQGAAGMARQKVIVKHLESMQNFGSIDVLCSDKTGTLTGGAMVLDQALNLEKRVPDRVLLLAYLNSSYETGIRSPLDDAIVKHVQLEISTYQKQAEIPFDFERRRLSVVAAQGGQTFLITKGAPESMLEVCARYEIDETLHALDEQVRARCIKLYRDLSAQGLRVLAVASRPIERQSAYRTIDEQQLILAGFVTFADPPLPDMVFIGPLSSIYDFLTFFLLLAVFHADVPLFQTGWFVESLATQTLVLFVIRTAGNPLRTRPSRPLAVTTCLIVAVGVVLPFTPLAAGLGFVPLPGLYFLFLAGNTLTYLLLVEIAKRWVMQKS